MPASTCWGVVAWELVQSRPVGDHETREAQLPFENVGDEPAVHVHGDAVPAAVRDHHRAHPGANGREVAGEVNRPQLLFGNAGVALIFASGRGPIGEKMFRAREHPAAPGFESADGRRPHRGGQLRRLTEPLVGSAPAFVAWHGDARGEGPVRARAGHLDRGGAGHLFDEGGIAGATEADVVGEDHRPLHAAVSVDRVGAVQDGNGQARGERGPLKFVRRVGPGARLVGRGEGVAAVQDRAQMELRDVARRIPGRCDRPGSSARSFRPGSSGRAALRHPACARRRPPGHSTGWPADGYSRRRRPRRRTRG